MKKHEMTRKIEAAFAREDWDEARALLLRELKEQPQNHWLLTRLSTTYYEQRKYDQALKFVRKAFRLMPDCPLVLWDYAGTLDALGKSKQALKIYWDLIRKGPREVGKGTCGEGLEWAYSLLADCVFRAAICWEHLKKNEIALRWLQAFVKLRADWTGGLYRAEDALTRIEKLAHDNPGKVGDQFDEIKELFLPDLARAI